MSADLQYWRNKGRSDALLQAPYSEPLWAPMDARDAYREGFQEPRVITRVMTDELKTKDGCA